LKTWKCAMTPYLANCFQFSPSTYITPAYFFFHHILTYHSSA
jgi:hypothetical protein